VRRILLALVGLCYVASIPWYRSAGDAELRLWWGLPDWVAVAFGCYALAACLNAAAWLWTGVPDEPDEALRRLADPAAADPEPRARARAEAGEPR